ncbi:MAG: hypothetical protein WB919_07995 [Candidatus Sulfotelmatobacter sp.]
MRTDTNKYVRWIVPSIGDLIFIVLLGLLAFTALSVRLLGDAGIGWHIRTGQLILSTHAIPRVDPFSSTMSGQPWFAWEWLYDVVVGWLDSVAGLNAVVFLTASIIALIFSWTFRLLLQRDTNFLVALCLVLLAASAAMIHFFARPHVVSWLFTVLWFWILESAEKKTGRSPRLLWLLPLLTLVWVNVHGGFLVGFVLLGISWLSAAWRWLKLSDDHFDDALEKIRAGKRARDLAIVGLASALATLANPYGWRLHLHIYRYLSNRFLMDHIDEFQSPNFHGVAQKCFAILLLLTLVALATRRAPRESSLSTPLVALFAVYSGLYASRNIPVSSLLLILLIGPRLSDAFQKLAESFAKIRGASQSHAAQEISFFQRMQSIELSVRGHLWPIAAVALMCWITFHAGNLGATPLMSAHFDSKRFPVGAVDYLQAQHAEGSVLAPDSWGGYLIYRLYPPIKVAVDDRHDFYGEAFLKSYLKMMHAEPGWQDFLEHHPVRYVVIPKDSALASVLAETPSWKQIYSDELAVVFVAVQTSSQ